MRVAFHGATRFEEFVRRAELTEATASTRLHELVEHGQVLRHGFSDRRASSRFASHRLQGC